MIIPRTTNQSYDQNFFKKMSIKTYKNVTEISFQTLLLLTKLFSLTECPLTCWRVYIPPPEHILFVSQEVPVSAGRIDCVGRCDFCLKL
jgi:hypothetical protein